MPTSSSPPPSSSPMSSKRSHDGELAFLNHSPTTVANRLPPDVDNKPLARQKRRRTSKEDEEILKAEYQKNPKPDKASRLDIVSRVALGEKEVQIWFQNKRQNDRRRSRPVGHSSPQLMSSSSTMSDPPMEDEASSSDAHVPSEPKSPGATPHLQTADSTTQMSRPEEPTELPGPATTIPELTGGTHIEKKETAEVVEEAEGATEAVKEPTESSEVAVSETVEEEKVESQASDITIESNTIASTDPHTVDTAPTELSSSQQNASSQGASQSHTNWISNRRSASFMRSSDDYAPEVITFPHSTQATKEDPSAQESTTRTMKRAHSFVRIATNEDGSARVVTDLDKTPSPPHHKTNGAPFARAAAGLRRSYSAAGLNERLAAASREERSPKLPRTSTNVGRSRDSRAWEFWCDPDTRYNTSLTTRAEQEGSGSAADAIGLLRANRRVLAQNQARQNTPVISRHQSAKMSPQYSGVKKARGRMQRASTITGRLQSKTSDSSETDELAQTESDKENWAPDDAAKAQQARARSRQVAQSPAVKYARRILGENKDIMSQSNSLGAMLSKSTPKKAAPRRSSSDPEDDEELRMFMGSASREGTRTVSSAEEAGCVEGLLKLSQGQWR